jgi:putative Holliday junction resolvase
VNPNATNSAGRLLGVDFGTVRIGLAITDPERRLASPLGIYTRENTGADAAFFRELVQSEQVAGLVVGLPIHNDGREGIKAREAREFGTWLAGVTGLAVAYWDERFSTVEAENALWNAGLTHQKRRSRRDSVAAQILLQGYLEAGCPEAKPEGSDKIFSDDSS